MERRRSAPFCSLTPHEAHQELVEKPLGDTYAAGSAIVEQVKQRSLPLAVPHRLLVARHGREIIERVRAGEIGQLELVEIENNRWDIINAGIH
jgi:predicted dehydrogenase